MLGTPFLHHQPKQNTVVSLKQPSRHGCQVSGSGRLPPLPRQAALWVYAIWQHAEHVWKWLWITGNCHLKEYGSNSLSIRLLLWASLMHPGGIDFRWSESDCMSRVKATTKLSEWFYNNGWFNRPKLCWILFISGVHLMYAQVEFVS